MKCKYQSDVECRYAKHLKYPTFANLPCKECELYDPHRVKLSRGCAEPAIAIIIILILILL